MFYICILSLSVFLLLVSPALFQVAAGDWEAAIDCASVVSGRRSWRRKECWLIVGFGWCWICGLEDGRSVRMERKGLWLLFDLEIEDLLVSVGEEKETKWSARE